MKANSVYLLLWAILMQLAALGCCFVTVAGGDYTGVLTAALTLTLLACALLVLPFRRGGMGMKILCGVLALPTLLVVLNFLGWALHGTWD
jgi:hypothetical protein